MLNNNNNNLACAPAREPGFLVPLNAKRQLELDTWISAILAGRIILSQSSFGSRWDSLITVSFSTGDTLRLNWAEFAYFVSQYNSLINS